MPDISKVKGQRWITLIADENECQSCHFVYRQPLSKNEYICPHCRTKADGGFTYFHFGILGMINVMQDLFHTPSKAGSTGLTVESHELAVVVFFCTLVETLFENLLREMMNAKALPIKIQERLLWDNLSGGQRVGKLFPILAGEKWKSAVAAVSDKASKFDFEEPLAYFQEAKEARNKFLHPPGNKSAIRLGMAQKCVRQTPLLLTLFVRLHNRYLVERPTPAGRLES